ncbi:MAG: MBOAT family O-acyltransferase [Thermodesulfobacteriota bacterium]
MLFNSYEYILIFLPLSLIVYFILNYSKLTLAAKTWLVLASLFFYGWWNPKYLPLIMGSILFNFAVGGFLVKANNGTGVRKAALVVGVAGNIGLLSYFKYYDFFISNLNYATGSNVPLMHIVLPLGISFFTFTQIAYLADTYQGMVTEYGLINYSLFVTFYPHLLAGPIIHHKEMMPQFDRIKNKILNYKNLSMGLFLLSLGLFKKVVIADRFAVWADKGFSHAHLLNFSEAWITTLSYSMQIYFDFSGYTDMAIGSALMFNIRLPINFNSPYRALNIQDFWRRWHITLSRFLRDYIYIPLGGNRVSEPHIYGNLLITFLIGGLWHGAGWTFVLWGALHGLAIVVHRWWKTLGITMPRLLAWFLTFNFVNITWVFFRGKNFDNAMDVFKGMLGLNGIVLPVSLTSPFGFLTKYGVKFGDGDWDMTIIASLIIFLVLSILFKNSNQMLDDFNPSVANMGFTVLLLVTSVFTMGSLRSEFIYFNF